MINEKIKIISCGGTFEKKYDPISGNLIFNKSCINELIKKSRLTKEFCFENIMMIDSLDMTNKHRTQVANNVQRSKEDKILIIHGTDTMVETGITIAKARQLVIGYEARRKDPLNPSHPLAEKQKAFKGITLNSHFDISFVKDGDI